LAWAQGVSRLQATGACLLFPGHTRTRVTSQRRTRPYTTTGHSTTTSSPGEAVAHEGNGAIDGSSADGVGSSLQARTRIALNCLGTGRVDGRRFHFLFRIGVGSFSLVDDENPATKNLPTTMRLLPPVVADLAPTRVWQVESSKGRRPHKQGSTGETWCGSGGTSCSRGGRGCDVRLCLVATRIEGSTSVHQADAPPSENPTDACASDEGCSANSGEYLPPNPHVRRSACARTRPTP
jgi:hypothetical protein